MYNEFHLIYNEPQTDGSGVKINRVAQNPPTAVHLQLANHAASRGTICCAYSYTGLARRALQKPGAALPPFNALLPDACSPLRPKEPLYKSLYRNPAGHVEALSYIYFHIKVAVYDSGYFSRQLSSRKRNAALEMAGDKLLAPHISIKTSVRSPDEPSGSNVTDFTNRSNLLLHHSLTVCLHPPHLPRVLISLCTLPRQPQNH
jgi:hypothetical protein